MSLPLTTRRGLFFPLSTLHLCRGLLCSGLLDCFFSLAPRIVGSLVTTIASPIAFETSSSIFLPCLARSCLSSCPISLSRMVFITRLPRSSYILCYGLLFLRGSLLRSSRLFLYAEKLLKKGTYPSEELSAPTRYPIRLFLIRIYASLY